MKKLSIIILFPLAAFAQQRPNISTIIRPSLRSVAPTTIPAITAQGDAIGPVSVKIFGATGDYLHDDYPPIQAACDYGIKNHKDVFFPVGHYKITHPIILQNVVNGRWQFFTIKLIGEHPAKSASDEYLSQIFYTGNQGFAIGVQIGRGITIENLSLQGVYKFPDKITQYNIGTYKYADWADGSVIDKRFAPYAGIVIDPFCDSATIPKSDGYDSLRRFYVPFAGQGGTSGVEIKQCAIKYFMVGACLTPNPQLANDEMINFIDDDIEMVRTAIAIGQDQSKEIHIDRLKVWGPCHTILDGRRYGVGTGGGSVMIEGLNVAGSVNQLFNVITDRFPLSAKDIYSESLFRIGTVQGSAGANFINFQVDFLNGAGMPAADYLFAGGPATFYGGSLRYYNGDPTQRMLFNNASVTFRDMTLSTAPIIYSIQGIDLSAHPQPSFSNVNLYSPYGTYGGVIGRDVGIPMPYFYFNGSDPLYHTSRYKYKTVGISYDIQQNQDYEDIQSIGAFAVRVDRTLWTAYFIASTPFVKPGDYLVSGDISQYYDLNLNSAPTAQIGRVTRIAGDTVFLDQVGLNVTSGTYNLYVDFVYNSQDGFVFNTTAGSPVMTGVQMNSIRASIAPGSRLTTSLLPKGSYVVACDPTAKTITMSAPATVTQTDVTLVNGNPDITMRSDYPPDHWIGNSLYSMYGVYPGRYVAPGGTYQINSLLPQGNNSIHPFNFKPIQ